VHLSVEWRDLPDDAWHHTVRTIQGRDVPASETVWMRSREVWVHAVDLDNGATFADIPEPVLKRLLNDITGAWHTRGTDAGLVVKVAGTDSSFGDTDAADPTVVTGALAGVVRWAAGRGADGVEASKSSVSTMVPVAPKWI
ncbi:maleylpyruvate isomerase family mycothiol-dependent enzyme, partial [Arthrobacter methylotrophus]